MGAQTFFEYQDGSDVNEAFRQACDSAGYEHGHGYSGSLAEKHAYVIIAHDPMAYADAYAHANELINGGDSRIDDKWGPAGAIRVKGGTRHTFVSGSYNTNARGLPATPEDQRKKDAIGWHDVEYDGWLFFGWASS